MQLRAIPLVVTSFLTLEAFPCSPQFVLFSTVNLTTTSLMTIISSPSLCVLSQTLGVNQVYPDLLDPGSGQQPTTLFSRSVWSWPCHAIHKSPPASSRVFRYMSRRD